MRPAGEPDSSTLGLLARRVASYFTVGVYTLNAPFGYLILATLSALWRRDPVRRARRLQAITSFAYGFMHDWLRLVAITDFNHRTALPEVPQGPCVIVANHPTLMDITSLGAVFGGGCTIAKPEMFDRRLLHPLLAGAGHVRGPDGNPFSVGQVIEESVARIRSGFPLIVFPEGTRSPPGRLLPFGRIAFEIAVQAGVPLVSIGIRCAPPYLSKEVSVFRPPSPTARLRMELIATDPPESLGADSRALQARIENRFLTWFDGG